MVGMAALCALAEPCYEMRAEGADAVFEPLGGIHVRKVRVESAATRPSPYFSTISDASIGLANR